MRKHSIILILMFLLLTVMALAAAPEPRSPTNFTNESVEIAVPSSAQEYNVSGGTISTIQLTGITQNPHWKAFVGNVTGSYSLSDSQNRTIYDWTLATITGEVYATRRSTLVSWDDVRCANSSSIYDEERLINFTNSSVDRINYTFSTGTHPAFYVGTVPIAANTCPRVYTYVNSASGSTNFPEVLLHDEQYLIYSSLVNTTQQGFDQSHYHFQMIVPDYGDETIDNQIVYYFYVELV